MNCPRLFLEAGKGIPLSCKDFDALCGLREEATRSGLSLPGYEEDQLVEPGSAYLRAQIWAYEEQSLSAGF